MTYLHEPAAGDWPPVWRRMAEGRQLRACILLLCTAAPHSIAALCRTLALSNSPCRRHVRRLVASGHLRVVTPHGANTPAIYGVVK